jgi:hypothetical protein
MIELHNERPIVRLSALVEHAVVPINVVVGNEALQSPGMFRLFWGKYPFSKSGAPFMS